MSYSILFVSEETKYIIIFVGECFGVLNYTSSEHSLHDIYLHI